MYTTPKQSVSSINTSNTCDELSPSVATMDAKRRRTPLPLAVRSRLRRAFGMEGRRMALAFPEICQPAQCTRQVVSISARKKLPQLSCGSSVLRRQLLFIKAVRRQLLFIRGERAFLRAKKSLGQQDIFSHNSHSCGIQYSGQTEDDWKRFFGPIQAFHLDVLQRTHVLVYCWAYSVCRGARWSL